jgi:WG containing repeat
MPAHILKKALLCVMVFLVTSLGIVISTVACEWDYLIWIPRSPTADPLYRFIQGGKAGYIDQNGRVIIPPSLPWWGEHGGEFHDGLLEIGLSDGVYVDVTGKKVIDRGLYRGWDFSEGLAAAMENGSKRWGYINTTGEFAIPPRFETSPNGYVWPFEGGLAKVQVGELFGYIDHSGMFVIEPGFIDADSFFDDVARVVVEGPCFYFRILEENPCPEGGIVPESAKNQTNVPPCKYTFIDRTGRVVSKRRFEYLRRFSEGLAPFAEGKKWGYIDKTGETAISPQFESAAPFSDGLALVSLYGRYGYINHSGTYVIPAQFEYAEDFVDGRAVVGKPDFQYWYIGQDGKQAFPGGFELASPFFEGLAHVKLLTEPKLTVTDESSEDGRYAYIDRNGRVLFTYER